MKITYKIEISEDDENWKLWDKPKQEPDETYLTKELKVAKTFNNKKALSIRLVKTERIITMQI